MYKGCIETQYFVIEELLNDIPLQSLFLIGPILKRRV